MRTCLAAVIPLLFAFSLPAAADDQVLDATTVTCAELAEADQSQSKDDALGGFALLAWMAGYHATQEQGTVVDFDGLKTDIQRTVEFCRDHPKIGVYTASEKFMGENATEATSGAVDLSTFKCQRIVDLANSNDDDTLAFIMMWLAGYYASYAEDKSIDTEKMRKEGYELGKECALNRGTGLITVADKHMQHE
jgi:hypothetical protein